MSDNLPILTLKRYTLRSNITMYFTPINDVTVANTPDDLEYFRNRLQETSLDDSIHGALIDVEHTTDIQTCEVYIHSAKLSIYKATSAIDSRLLASMSTIRLATTTLPSHTPTNKAYNKEFRSLEIYYRDLMCEVCIL